MSTLQEIEEAIEKLPIQQFWQLAEWLDERKSAAWDRQIEKDAKNGKLNRVAEEAVREYRAGR